MPVSASVRKYFSYVQEISAFGKGLFVKITSVYRLACGIKRELCQ